MQTDTTMHYTARYPMTICGHIYAPGQAILDQDIPATVLQRLERTGRIAIGLTGLAAPSSDAVAAARPTAPVPVPGSAHGEARPEDPAEASPAEPEGAPAVRPDAYRKRWQRAHKKAGVDMPFKAFLCARCAQAGLESDGSIEDLLGRLRQAEVTPGAAHG